MHCLRFQEHREDQDQLRDSKDFLFSICLSSSPIFPRTFTISFCGNIVVWCNRRIVHCIEAIAGDLFIRKLKVALLVHIGCVFSSEKEIAVDEAILNQGLENVSGAVRSARIKHFFYGSELCEVD